MTSFRAKHIAIFGLLCISIIYFTYSLIFIVRNDNPKLEIIDFPELIHLETGDIKNVSFKIQNSGSTDLIVKRILPSCGCISLSVRDLVIAPGKIETIDLKFSDINGSGTRVYDVVFKTNESDGKPILRQITAVVSDSLKFVFGNQDFGKKYFKTLPFEISGLPISETIKYSIESDCPWCEFETEKTDKTIIGKLKIKDTFPEGWFDLQLTVSLTNANKVLRKTTSVSVARDSEKFWVERPFFMGYMSNENAFQTVKIEGVVPDIHEAKYVGTNFIKEHVVVDKNSIRIFRDESRPTVGSSTGHILIMSKREEKILFVYPVYISF